MLKNKNIRPALFIGFSLLFTMMTVYFYQMFFTPNFLLDGRRETTITIKANLSLNHIADSLKRKGILEDVLSFMFVSKVLDYTDNVKAGTYTIPPRANNLTVVRLLKKGAGTVKVTFTNARLKEELPAKLCKNIIADPDELYSLLCDPAVTAQYGFDTTTIGCMFIPNTYEVYTSTDARGLLERMKKEYDIFWNKERRQKAENIGLTPIQVSILASIVQAETKKNEEKPTIAGVYMNRLNKRMPLQADPTLVFAARDFTIKRVLSGHKEIDSPYNTYKYTGLPPGPINIPDISSIDAVLDYEKHRYVYFCAKEDFSGYHNFAETLDEQTNNANRYRRALDRAGITKN
jgi:UPF0755 protein